MFITADLLIGWKESPVTTQLQFQQLFQLFQAGCRFACSLLCMFYQNSVHLFSQCRVFNSSWLSNLRINPLPPSLNQIHLFPSSLPSSPGRAIAPPQWWATRLAPPPRPSPGSLSRWSRSNSRHPSPGRKNARFSSRWIPCLIPSSPRVQSECSKKTKRHCLACRARVSKLGTLNSGKSSSFFSEWKWPNGHMYNLVDSIPVIVI